MNVALNRFLVVLGCCLAFVLIGSGCGGGGTEYAVGDCLSDEVNEDGEVDEVSCAAKDSFTVEKLAGNGGQPDCGYDHKYTSSHRVGIITIPTRYVTDAVSETTYCGPANFDPYGSAFPPEDE